MSEPEKPKCDCCEAFEEGVRQGRGYGEAAGRAEERERLVAWLQRRSQQTLRAEASAALWVAAKLIEANQPPDVA